MSASHPSAATSVHSVAPTPRSWLIRIAGLMVGLGLLALSGFVLLDGPDTEPQRPTVDPAGEPAAVPPDVSIPG